VEEVDQARPVEKPHSAAGWDDLGADDPIDRQEQCYSQAVATVMANRSNNLWPGQPQTAASAAGLQGLMCPRRGQPGFQRGRMSAKPAPSRDRKGGLGTSAVRSRWHRSPPFLAGSVRGIRNRNVSGGMERKHAGFFGKPPLTGCRRDRSHRCRILQRPPGVKSRRRFLSKSYDRRHVGAVAYPQLRAPTWSRLQASSDRPRIGPSIGVQ
jgi:hypothetical protein